LDFYVLGFQYVGGLVPVGVGKHEDALGAYLRDGLTHMRDGLILTERCQPPD
jgi:hypothetical protein